MQPHPTLPASEIIKNPPLADTQFETIGQSRDGRPLLGYQIGNGNINISLIAGCHAGEPVGPWMLKRLASFLSKLPDTHLLIKAYHWTLIPEMNPDGTVVNNRWSPPEASAFESSTYFSLDAYVRFVSRERPQDDIEFSFPNSTSNSAHSCRPENEAAATYLSRIAIENGTFQLHISFHGLAFGGGPWFLIKKNKIRDTQELRTALRRQVQQLGYSLHDIERHGEKGFNRIERGFCTHPTAEAMSAFFLSQNDVKTAACFTNSSMDFIHGLGGDPLTLVSEMPLFIIKGAGDVILPEDPVMKNVKDRILPGLQLTAQKQECLTSKDLTDAGITPMSVEDQMLLQISFLELGLQTLSRPTI